MRHVFPSVQLDYWFVLTCFQRNNDFSVVSVSQHNYLSAKSSNHCELKALFIGFQGEIGFCALIILGVGLFDTQKTPIWIILGQEKKSIIFLKMVPM